MRWMLLVVTALLGAGMAFGALSAHGVAEPAQENVQQQR